MSAGRGRHGAVRVPDARPPGPLPLHRRPRALRRLHRLSQRGGRGPPSLYVLQNDESPPGRVGRRAAAVGARPLSRPRPRDPRPALRRRPHNPDPHGLQLD